MTRARVVLLAAEGVANVCIAREVGVSLPAALLWRERLAKPVGWVLREYVSTYDASIVQSRLSPPAPG